MTLVGGIKYTVISDKYAIVGTNASARIHNAYDVSPTSINIPSTVSINGKSYIIQEIGQYAFFQCTTVQSITLPSTIKQINQFAFDLMISSANITLPEELEFIGVWALSSNHYNSIFIPKNVKYIGNGAFSYTKYVRSYDVHPENKYFCNDEYGVLYDIYKPK